MSRTGIGWLSTSSAEITRARAVLDALRKPGVIDELGFLMLNGAFAERLYPGVTTIMTRARYLIFIPAIYQYLERTRKAVGKDADRLARDLQFELRNALERNETNFIGKEGGRNLARTPSAIYWSAFGTLGLATRRISEASYQRQLSDGAIGPSRYQDDDDAFHDDEPNSLWTDSLKLAHILPDGQFPASTSFRLRRAEAAFLASRYANLKSDGQDCLVTVMVSLGQSHGASSLDSIEYPWLIPNVSPQLAPILEHARRLSLAARGATLQYYGMVMDLKRDDGQGVEDAFVEWWKEARRDLSTWDTASFFAQMTLWQAGRGRKDRDFMVSWLSRITSVSTGQAAFVDKQARNIIGAREDHVRPGKQRLRRKEQRENWKLPDGIGSSPYLMDYRHRVGRQIAQDIVEGLERGAL